MISWNGNHDPARFIWTGDEGFWRNQFVRFTRQVGRGEGILRIFADSRYRLKVNGRMVWCGPARFVTSHPEYDKVDITAWLERETNLIEVEVNFFGTSSFQTMPDGRPCFWCSGHAAGEDVSTPGLWRAERLIAWDANAPAFSFAQSPVEICDTRLMAQGRPVDVKVLDERECPWGKLQPYSGVPLSLDTILKPVTVELAAPLLDEELRVGFVCILSQEYKRHQKDTAQRPWVGFRTWIFSPTHQVVKVSCFWSELFCNGQHVSVDTDTPLGNHAVAEMELNQGWNYLTGKFEVFSEVWGYCLGFPKRAGLLLKARPQQDFAEVFQVGPLEWDKDFPLPDKDKTDLPAGWRLDSGSVLQITPARLVAWDSPTDDAIRELPFDKLERARAFTASEAVWCFSFAGEFMGYVEAEVEAPAGAILDISCDDWQSRSGTVALYQSNPFTDSTDRFILRGGKQRVQLFHPRGGKYLQLTLRTPDGRPQKLCVHDLEVRARYRVIRDDTYFSCDQPVINWLWPTAFRTLVSSTDECYTDCPWRERACYIGDLHVNLHLDAILSADLRTSRRCIGLFAQAALPDGQLPGCAPSWLRKTHEDYNLIWILTLRDYWALTGDAEFVSEMWPTLNNIWQSAAWNVGSTGLWNLNKGRMFVDWGVCKSERSGAGNAVLNLLRFAALKASGELSHALGESVKENQFRQEANFVEEKIFQHLWDDKRGRLSAAIGHTTNALHANVLALAFEAGSDPVRMEILESIEPELEANFRKGKEQGLHGGHLELYFLHFLLPALAEHGRPDLAEKIILEHYGFLKKLNLDTLPECFCQVENYVGSRCHSWSGAGAIYAARYILGMRNVKTANRHQIVFDPVVHSIRQAAGKIAHPLGWIEVSWTKLGDNIKYSISKPEGVDIQFRPGLRQGVLTVLS